MFGITAQKLRSDLRNAHNPDMHRRRAIIDLSLLGIANMSLGTLVQTGIIEHLPDPPVQGFNSDKVILSDEAYAFGAPDAAIATFSLATNLPLAAFGGADRADVQPLVPIIAAAKAAVDVGMGAWYFYQMKYKERTWCAYCLMTSAINVAVFALTIPEVLKVIRKKFINPQSEAG